MYRYLKFTVDLQREWDALALSGALMLFRLWLNGSVGPIYMEKIQAIVCLGLGVSVHDTAMLASAPKARTLSNLNSRDSRP